MDAPRPLKRDGVAVCSRMRSAMPLWDAFHVPVLPVAAVAGVEAPSLVAGAVVPVVGLVPKSEAPPPKRPVEGAVGAVEPVVVADVAGVAAAAAAP